MSDIVTHSTLLALSDAVAAVVGGVARSVASVRSHRLRASGFAWRPGLIVTASESVAEEGEIDVVLPGGEVVAATIKGRDAATDIALLRVERPFDPIGGLATGAVETGSLAIVVGALWGAPTAALAVVSRSTGPWRSLRGGEIDARIELDVRLRGSTEGALALDAAGRVIGMVVSGPRRRALVIPSSTVERVAATLETEGRIARGYLGLGLQAVRIEDDGDAAGDRIGAMVMTVASAGPGAAAGVRQGDVIVRWNGRPIDGVKSIVRELGPASIGTSVRLSNRRAGAPIEVDVTIGARPDA